jgi:hypothetical protein
MKPKALGLEVILESPDDIPQVFTSSYGETFVANIIR